MQDSPIDSFKRAFTPLPLGTVRPKGWLYDQLRIQADGLSGHLDEGFFPDLTSNSGWLGGDGEDWEVAPYWLDGLVPMAWLLGDEKLKKKAHRWVNHTLTTLGNDGWIGPVTDHDDKWWPRAIMLKVLAQYAEATSDFRVVPAMTRYFELLNASLPADPLNVWGKFRWGEYLISLLWLMERRELPFATELARTLSYQGYNWSDHFNFFMVEEKIREHPNLSTHVVNHAMAVKYPAMLSLFSGRKADRAATDRAFAMLDRFHGTATGIFTGDEHLSGLSPSQGTELCAVTEFMYSLETLSSLFGNVSYADRLESVTYNNLPGTFTPDMWAHQYDQLANQVICSLEKRDMTNGPESLTFGLMPNYKCCTANFNQGWPKFIANMWMQSPDGGLAAVAHGPSEVKTNIGGTALTISADTEYPFNGRISYSVSTAGTIRMPLHLRIPAWAEKATVKVNSEAAVEAVPDSFHRIVRDWNDGDRVTLSLPLNLRVSRRFNNSAAIHRGPLTFSLRIGSRWKQIKGELPHADYEVFPNTKWNYALILDEARPEANLTVSEKPVKMPCFSELNAPVVITAKAKEVPGWGMENASAAPPPSSPVACDTPEETIDLIPYGSAKLRITEFPVCE